MPLQKASLMLLAPHLPINLIKEAVLDLPHGVAVGEHLIACITHVLVM